MRPRALRAGDLVAVAAPAGPVDAERLEKGVAELRSLGLEVRVADGVLDRDAFTAGAAEKRLAQLHGLLADDEVRAIVCARGGAGTVHLLPRLDRELVLAHPKLVVGYSDVTALHLALGRLGVASLHGPMVARELAAGEPGYDRDSLWHGLTGEGEPWSSGPDVLVPARDGRAEGILRGGCLSLLAASVGTPWGLATAGEPTILFVEDMDEAPYRIDRMLRQLVAAGALDGVAGVVLGKMKGCRPGPGEGYTLEGVVLRALDPVDVPVAIGLPSGHAASPCVTLPLGVRASLDCHGSTARLVVLEPAVE
jgi:muramoyltetrapeptide carboxypeptidase